MVMSTGCSDRVPEFSSQQSHDGSQLCVTSVQRIQCNFQASRSVYICDVYTSMQLNAHTYMQIKAHTFKIKINKNI